MLKILITDKSGMPRNWATLEDGACYYARSKVLWEVGSTVHTFLGGHNGEGEQSKIEVKSILGCSGPLAAESWLERTSVHVQRAILFKRDLNMCCYCLKQLNDSALTIDHILPKSRGGKHVWENCVASCKSCNHYKGARTPEEAGMKLHYVPYRPNAAEKIIIENRNILADQNLFLLSHIPKHSRLHS